MKVSFYIAVLLGGSVLSSCIEEYNELPTGKTEQRVVIDGQIVGGRDCVFSLHWSSAFGEEPYNAFMPIAHASVMVMGSGGDIFLGKEVASDPGHYVVPVGVLDSRQQYSLRVGVPAAGTYVSQPMSPLDAPDIAEVTFEQPRDDHQINFLVSTADPQGPACFLWEYDETWEIFTPYTAYWEYLYEVTEGEDPFSPTYEGDFYRIDRDKLTNHGWCTYTSKETIISDNDDYGHGAIKKLCLYQRHPDNNRFQTRYLARIRQMAITPQEYEYRHLLTTQSSGMGGLFTPMPSELPSNITSPGDSPRAIGFIGVRGRIGEAELYVRRSDVGHHDTYRVVFVPDSMVVDPVTMLSQGYRVITYNEQSQEVQWSDRWVIDCTDHFWGASLQRPTYWRDSSSD